MTDPAEIAALRAALVAEQAARREAEARNTGLEAVIAHLRLTIAQTKRARFGASSERGDKLDTSKNLLASTTAPRSIRELAADRIATNRVDRTVQLIEQMELQLEVLETTAAEAATAVEREDVVHGVSRRKPVRAPLPAHLPRERIVLPSPAACPCCNGALSKLGEDVTETLEVIPRQWKVVQTVREKWVCRACEAITQPPAPFHAISRGRAGPNLLASILEAKFGQHLPLNRQSEGFAREGIE